MALLRLAKHLQVGLSHQALLPAIEADRNLSPPGPTEGRSITLRKMGHHASLARVWTAHDPHLRAEVQHKLRACLRLGALASEGSVDNHLRAHCPASRLRRTTNLRLPPPLGP